MTVLEIVRKSPSERRREHSKNRREEMRARGLCTTCGNKPVTVNRYGRKATKCVGCIERTRQQTADRTAKAIRAGLCHICHKQPPRESRVLCADCNVKQILRQKTSVWLNRFILLKRMGGKCVRCGTTDLRVLTLDHIQPFHHRIPENKNKWYEIVKKIRSSKKFHEQILADQRKGVYQLLCANCNRLHFLETASKHSEKYITIALKRVVEMEDQGQF